MSTMTQIQQAIEKLPAAEKTALSIWLRSQSEPELSEAEEAALLAALDKAALELDSGLGQSIDQVRGLASQWATK